LADRVEQTYTGITAVVQVWLSRVRKIASAGLAQWCLANVRTSV